MNAEPRLVSAPVCAVPTGVAVGLLETNSAPAGLSAIFVRRHAELTRLPGLGHYPQVESPETVYDVIGRHAAQSWW